MGRGSSGASRVSSGPQPDAKSESQLKSKLEEYATKEVVFVDAEGNVTDLTTRSDTDPGLAYIEEIEISTDKGTYRTVNRGRGYESYLVEVTRDGETTRIGSRENSLGPNFPRTEGRVFERQSRYGNYDESVRVRREISEAILSNYRNA